MKEERHSQLCNHIVESGRRPQRRCLEPAVQVCQPFCFFCFTTGLLGTDVAAFRSYQCKLAFSMLVMCRSHQIHNVPFQPNRTVLVLQQNA